jgi:hypothetical protein
MTGEHRVSHLAIMMGTVEPGFFTLLRVRGGWGARNRLPVMRDKDPAS